MTCMVWRPTEMTAVFLSITPNHTSMNEFEKRMNALRLQFRDERVQITKDCNRTIGRLNSAIGMVNTPEAREALRAEKARVYEASRQSMKYSRLCYLQQLEALEDEYRIHLDKSPSKRQLRRMIAILGNVADENGGKSLSIAFGEGRRATITFS